MSKLKVLEEWWNSLGGAGSGNFGHAGLPGKRGGSVARGKGGAGTVKGGKPLKVGGMPTKDSPVMITVGDKSHKVLHSEHTGKKFVYKGYKEGTVIGELEKPFSGQYSFAWNDGKRNWLATRLNVVAGIKRKESGPPIGSTLKITPIGKIDDED